MESWNFEHLLGKIDFKPQENHFFDLWQYKNRDAVDVQEGVLHSENLSEYLSKTPVAVSDNQWSGGLRLIYSYTNIDLDDDGSDDEVLWSQSDFIKIVESFRLPKRLAQMIGRNHCCFTEFYLDQADGKLDRYSYIFSTLFHHYPFYTIAASWDPKSNITHAYLHCRAPADFQCISLYKEFLIRTATSSLHPVLLPVLVMDLETDGTLRDDEEWTSEISDIEDETSEEELDVLELNLSAIMQRLNAGSVFLSKIERECETVLLHLEKAQKMILDVLDLSSIMQRPGNVLMKHVTHLVDSRKNLSFRLQNLQQRSQTRLAFTYNLISQRSNKLMLQSLESQRQLHLLPEAIP